MATATVLRMPSQRRSIKLDDGPQTIRLLQSEIFRSGWSYTTIAVKSGCSAVTVGNIAIGHTKRPAMQTIARIFMALGWSIYAHEDR